MPFPCFPFSSVLVIFFRHTSHILFLPSLIKFIFPFFYGISNLISLLPYGIYLRRLLPISNYKGIYKLSNQQHYEWALLDTYDMLAPTYDNPQTKKDVIKWMKDCAMKKVACLHAGHLVVRGINI